MGYQWPPWPGAQPEDLARRVLPDAARYLGAPPEPLPAQASQAERAKRTQDIAAAVVAQRLSPDPVSLHDSAVQVRTPAEVLDGLASSLDVGLLLCGACIGSGLLPILVVTAAGSVILLVDLQRGLAGWKADERWERSLFEAGACTDAAAVREITRRGSYLTIDPLPLLGTGQAYEEPFTAAVRAGTLMLDTAPVRFAVDLATEWCGRRVEPLRVGCARRVVTSPGRVLVFEGSDEPTSQEDPAAVPVIRPLPRPVRPSVPPPRILLGREHELTTARAALTPGASVKIVGPPGSGRTALLRALAHDPALADRNPDGVVFVSGRTLDIDELLLDVYGAFFAADRPYRPSREEVEHALRDVAALVVVDDAKLIENWPLPRAALLLSTTARDASDSVTIPLRGLSERDAVALVEAHAGRKLDASERYAADEIARALQGHPGSLVLAGLQLRDGVPARDLRESVLADPSRGRSLIVTIFQRLGLTHRDLLSVLVATGVPTSLEHVAAVVAREGLDETILELASQGLAFGGPLHWLAPGHVGRALVSTVDSERRLRPMLGHLVVWAELHGTDCDRILADQELLIRVAVWAHDAGNRDEAVRLAKIVEGCLMRSGRWGTAARLAGVLAGSAAIVAVPVVAALQTGGSVSAPAVTPSADVSGVTAMPMQAAVVPAVLGVLSAPLIVAPAAVQNVADQLPHTEGVVKVLPSAVNFGSVDIGGSKDKTITLSNTSGGPVTVVRGLDTRGGTEFSIADDRCGAGPLAAGDSCTVVVRFSPRQRGSRTGSFTANSGSGTVPVTLRGSGRTTTTSGELTGVYRLTAAKYDCLPTAQNQLCSSLEPQLQSLLDQETAPYRNIVMPVQQVVACAGLECAYKVDDPTWGNFTLHPRGSKENHAYWVYDSALQADIEDAARDGNEQLREVLRGSGVDIQIETPSVFTPLRVRNRDTAGKVTAFDITLHRGYYVRVTAQGKSARVNVTDSFIFSFERTAT